jgi:hypothetical protein
LDQYATKCGKLAKELEARVSNLAAGCTLATTYSSVAQQLVDEQIRVSLGDGVVRVLMLCRESCQLALVLAL